MSTFNVYASGKKICLLPPSFPPKATSCWEGSRGQAELQTELHWVASNIDLAAVAKGI